MLFRGKESLHDQTCFLCQQSAEKYLKGILEEAGLPIPHTHILKKLLNLLLPLHPTLKNTSRTQTFLTRFAVGTRYPGDSANRRQAVSALRSATKIRERCRVILGIV
jgi:HEPN domain-containing protein